MAAARQSPAYAAATLAAVTFFCSHAFSPAASQECDLPPENGLNGPFRVDCGFVGITEEQCRSEGCCWEEIPGQPFCYFTEVGYEACRAFNFQADGPGFTQADIEAMRFNFESQIDTEGVGAVQASPDDDPPYYFHWMRDAALVMKDYMEINDNDLSVIKEKMDKYVEWVDKVQNKLDLNNIDVRVEPKFYIPSGEPYDGPWCRPQTDGPGLRALTLSKYGLLLLDSNDPQSQAEMIYEMVQFDLSWLSSNWPSAGCDLWEEVTSTDFFFNRLAFVAAFREAAKFGLALGRPEPLYTELADVIQLTVEAHIDSGERYIYQALERPVDTAVIQAIAAFGTDVFNPNSQEVSRTLATLERTFCEEYAINRLDSQKGIPGVLVGRYPGDFYQGGNPWQLLTAVLAEMYYLAGEANLGIVARGGGVPDPVGEEEQTAWLERFNLKDKGRPVNRLELANFQFSAGDAIMTRLSKYALANGGNVYEQMDRRYGFQLSAESLTWSYANILHALWTRDRVVNLRDEVRAQAGIHA